MPIMGYNFSAAALLTELHIECTLAQRAFEKLKKAAFHWNELQHGRDFDSAAPPIEIIADCTTLLAAFASLRRFLFENERSRPEILARCRKLRLLLGDPQLPTLSSAAVRNSWEHLDERLDALLPQLAVGDSLTHLHVAATPPGNRTTVLKRFDPTAFTIQFADQVVSLQPAMAEVTDLMTRIDAGFQRLHTERVDVWDA